MQWEIQTQCLGKLSGFNISLRVGKHVLLLLKEKGISLWEHWPSPSPVAPSASFLPRSYQWSKGGLQKAPGMAAPPALGHCCAEV